VAGFLPRWQEYLQTDVVSEKREKHNKRRPTRLLTSSFNGSLFLVSATQRKHLHQRLDTVQMYLVCDDPIDLGSSDEVIDAAKEQVNVMQRVSCKRPTQGHPDRQ
jgi:hypothetical protein